MKLYNKIYCKSVPYIAAILVLGLCWLLFKIFQPYYLWVIGGGA